ncbi:hypothetical protein PROFUN_12211 [Planoprotostelium fungivorum]|uniref:Uncharacterized protein n=1 Tax=Planoprotostelium fungivorum TaxID=1890364 RepID=A0A2P6N846_9EUKA|nr:hypothetical protein PROFUN_12211 [Planoprotostelium fungivorum]
MACLSCDPYLHRENLWIEREEGECCFSLWWSPSRNRRGSELLELSADGCLRYVTMRNLIVRLAQVIKEDAQSGRGYKSDSGREGRRISRS